mmetsp:Transcript_72882/g.144423  ORF Transcript_72882/g.144423 Transcript_72882/m.144423 type:complete len:395 (-) Transcript_72882:532-1716(-)
MDLWLQALFFGLLSSLSLPVGAILGLVMQPGKRSTALWMAFGSGALVFAVATQLYGRSLFKLLASSPDAFEGSRNGCAQRCQMHFRNINLQNIAGIGGAFLYVALQRLMVWVFGGGHSHGHNKDAGHGAKAEAQRFLAHEEVGGTVAVQDIAGLHSDLRQELLKGADLRPPSAEKHNNQSNGDGLNEATRNANLVDSSPIAALGPMRRQISNDTENPSRCTSRERLVSDHGINVAMSMWLGLMLDGIPESLMLGFMTNQNEISLVFLLAIFVANFPEAYSGSVVLNKAGMPKWRNFMLWLTVFLLTGILTMVGSLCAPTSVLRGSSLEKVRDETTAALEGLTGGAMLAMIATAMLPEAFKEAGELAGIFFVVGFTTSVFIDGLGARFAQPQSHL